MVQYKNSFSFVHKRLTHFSDLNFYFNGVHSLSFSFTQVLFVSDSKQNDNNNKKKTNLSDFINFSLTSYKIPIQLNFH